MAREISEERLAYDRVPIPFTPYKRLERGKLYVRKRTLPHPIHGYVQSYDVYSVVDLAGYRKGYEPRLELLGIYTPNPKDIFRLQNGHLPPYQPISTGDKLQEAMSNLPTFEAWRITPGFSQEKSAATTTSAADYWNAHLEHNALRSPSHGRGPDTDAGAFLAWQLEAAGDMIRELDKAPFADFNYIFEKFNRLKNNLKERDWTDPLSARENEALVKIKEDIEGLPADTELLSTIKVILLAIANRQPQAIEAQLDSLRNQLKMLPQTQAGTCYEDAWRFVIKEEEGLLTHGSVQNIGRRINHAWVELPTGYIWEPEHEKFHVRSGFYERAQPKVDAQYTATEAAIMAARTRNFGPWTEEERQRWLRGGKSPETIYLKPEPKVISQYPTRSFTITHGAATVTGRFQRKGEMAPDQVEPDIIVTVLQRGSEEEGLAAIKELEDTLRANVREVEDSELLKEVEPTIRVPVPPERAKYPLVLSMDGFKRDWEPKGWKIIFIGPTSTWRQEWGEWEAIRDLVQNALDETEAYQWGYDGEGFWISDKGKGVAVSDFLLGPPKLKPEYARGRFGEGMKISSLALLRAGYNVHIETVGRELWMIFMEQEADGRVQSLAALWKPDGTARGTKFHILGYFGPSYEDRFAINLPKSAIVARAPALVVKPFQRYNQLIQHEFPDGNRIFARDIYMRPISSLFSYNLWGFDMAPDRFGPKKEDDVWVDMGRLWACVKDVRLLELFFQMKSDPPMVDTDETHKLTMVDYQMGSNPETNDSYRAEVRKNKAAWLQAWKNTFGEDAVVRTNSDWDAIVKHLGYRPVGLAHGISATLMDAIPWDRQIIDQSQERLREVKVVPDSQLSDSQLAHLALARAIAARVAYDEPVGGVRAALIPPASDRVRTAGMYGRSTREVFIHVEQLFHGRSTVDTAIHEIAHHTSGAEDGEEKHNLEMTRVAGDVVSLVASGTFDDLIKAPGFRW